MTYLPDVDLWIALTVSGHVHHRTAAAWLEEAGDEILTFCRVTQMGFLRLLTNERVLGEDAFSADRAWRLLERLRRHDRVIFSPEPADLERTWQTTTMPHKAAFAMITDARWSPSIAVSTNTRNFQCEF